MIGITTTIRELSWHLHGETHLLVCPEPFDETKVLSALYLREALEAEGHQAKLLLGKDWGQKLPLSWPDEWFVRSLEKAESMEWQKIWCWGFERPEGFGVDRRGKLVTRKTVLRDLFLKSRNILQIIGLHHLSCVKKLSIEYPDSDFGISQFEFSVKLFDQLGPGGLCELAFHLVREIGQLSDPQKLLRALEQQMDHFDESKNDPLIYQLKSSLENQCQVH